MTPEEIAAKEIAEEVVERAVKRGATQVIVIVGFDDGVHHTHWRGTGLAIRGLLEIGAETIRRIFQSSYQAQQRGVSFTVMTGGGGTGGGRGGAG